jgi:hypothetical protein
MGKKRLPKSALWKVAVCLAVMLFASYGTWAAEPEIACHQYVAKQSTVTVMGADGSNPTVIFKNVRGTPAGTQPNWSPGGEWIVFVWPHYDNQIKGVWKMLPNGEGLRKILCYEGWGRGDIPVLHPLYPQWSPDGNWILVTIDPDINWLGIVDASEEVGSDCQSNLTLLYSPQPWDPTTSTGWKIVFGSTPWNHDGSKIAFFEVYLEEDSPTDYRLQVLDIEIVSGTPTLIDDHPIALPPNLKGLMLNQPMWFNGMEWQRDGGNILLFDTMDGTEHISWLDLDLDTYSVQAWGHLSEGWGANWSPDNNRIVYNLVGDLMVAEIVYETDGSPTVQSSSLIYPDRNECLGPDWKRGAPPCASAADCNDGNECTADVCSPEGQCLNPPDTDVTECDDGYGICFEGICETPDCWENSDCSDGDECTTDECVGGECRFTPIPDCGGSCLPKGETCTSDAECCSGSCHPIKLTCK